MANLLPTVKYFSGKKVEITCKTRGASKHNLDWVVSNATFLNMEILPQHVKIAQRQVKFRNNTYIITSKITISDFRQSLRLQCLAKGREGKARSENVYVLKMKGNLSF